MHKHAHTHTHIHTHTLPQPHVISITILFFLCLFLSLQNIWKFLSACLSSCLITPATWPKLQLTIFSNNTLILTPQLLLRCPFHWSKGCYSDLIWLKWAACDTLFEIFFFSFFLAFLSLMVSSRSPSWTPLLLPGLLPGLPQGPIPGPLFFFFKSDTIFVWFNLVSWLSLPPLDK